MEGPGMGSIFDEPLESEPPSGETEVGDDSAALAEEMMLAFERRDTAALASILRSLKGS